MTPTTFTIRVYGLLIHQGRVLLSRENIKGNIVTKFPGGGLEFGEGTLECLEREFMEELEIEVHNLQHFYTSEDFFASSFHTPPKQVLCIYYLVDSHQIDLIKLGDEMNTDLLQNHNDQVLYWKPISKLDVEDIALATDRIVANKLYLAFKEKA